jgi:hypothetical protein
MIGLVLVAALLAPPAAAFTMERLDIAVLENGDAEITADYTLTWVERIVVYVRIAHPELLLGQALREYSGKEVNVTSVTPGQTVLSIRDFAEVRETGNETFYVTPSLDFSMAGQAVRGYWFSPFVSVDASPELTTVSFPDGHQEAFFDTLVIPSITHEEGANPGCC